MTVEPRPHVAALFRERYTAEDVRQVRAFLEGQRTFHFPTSQHGLFPAAVAHAAEQNYTGYANVWLRDRHASKSFGSQPPPDQMPDTSPFPPGYGEDIDEENA